MKHTLLAILTMLSGAIASASLGPARLQLLDAYTGLPVADVDVSIHSDNGIRCSTFACPTDSNTWTGRSDSKGHVVVPPGVINLVTSVRAPGFKGSLEEDAARDGSGAIIVELIPEKLDSGGPMDLGMNYFKMIDARTGKDIVNAPASVELGRAQTLKLQTNSLGYIFIPVSSASMLATESTWVTIPGYQRKKLDYGGVNYKTRMVRSS